MANPKRLVFVALTLLFALSSARATELGRPTYPRDKWLFDLILRVSDNADLLSAHEALVRQRLLDMGVDPRGERESVSLSTLLRKRFADAAGMELFQPPRQVEVIEPLDGIDRVVRYRFPETFLFFSQIDTNQVGVAFEKPRPVEDPQVDIQMTTLRGYMRSLTAVALDDQWRKSLQAQAMAQQTSESVLNFTLPIKLPRTLERLIGKGEATNIRISGQESISISGTSTVRDNFLGNEIQQSQSLFPTLEMQQSLRVNLDGQVGEKIKVRVSHDSEKFGSDATEVKLSFEGDEDDIIRTIRAGNIDVTLPSSRLLGIQAQRGGLFGVKVEGALGPLDFTVLTSKEQSKQGKRSFSAAGGTTQEFTVSSTDYVKNRIFRLNAPYPFFFAQGNPYIIAPGDTLDIPSSLQDQSAAWDSTWTIDISTVDLYVSVPTGVVSGDKSNLLDVYPGRAYMETTGYYWGYTGGLPDPAAVPNLANYEDFVDAPRWRRLAVDEWRPLVDANSGKLIGVLLNSELSDDNQALGVTYDVVDDKGNLVMRVGRPWFSGDFDAIENPDNPGVPDDRIYYFKLIKPLSQTAPDPTNLSSYGQGFDLCWEYMFRNFYFMRGVGIDLSSLDVQILTTVKQTLREFDTVPPDGTRRRWINLFGLDNNDQQGNRIPKDTNLPAVGDGIIDTGSEANLVFPDLGLLEFPEMTPFADPSYLKGRYVEGGKGNDGVPAPDLYLKSLTATALQSNHFFDLVFKHSSTSSRLSLGTINVKENSEQVRLDGRILTRGVDYDIDYFSGEITLTGAASELNAQTNITVDFEVDPLFGGGRTSLNGINLGYHLGQNKTLSTTWLLQSKPSNNRKPRLGEEPTKNWVGNLSAKLQFQPKILTGLANLLPRVDSEGPSRLTLDGELAVSIPNPNTNGSAYLDDFEAVDKSDVIPMGREGWWWASLPAEYASDSDVNRRFQPQDRAYVRWYRPTPAVNREDLNPDLSEQERRDVVPALELQMEPPKGTDTFADTLFTGIMRGYGADLDLTEAQYLEFWVNDFQKNLADREGVLHFDFGFINEDFYWWQFNKNTGEFEFKQGVLNNEDQDNDGQLSTSEDVGLDGLANAVEGSAVTPFQNVPYRSDDPGGDDFDSSREDDTDPFPRINGLELNQRLDSEDINLNGSLDMADAYYTLTVPLNDTDHILVDVNRDYPTFVSDDDRKINDSWRKYRLDMKDIQLRLARLGEANFLAKAPDLSKVRFLRIWYEVPGGSTKGRRDLEFAEMRFLGNRWLTDGIHDSQSHERLPAGAEAPAEFRVGVLNNKDNPDYIPPVFPDTRNNVAEKEQSLQLDYANLAPGQEIRVRKDVPGSQGQDFSQYNELNFFWRAPLAVHLPAQLDPDQQGLVPFFWVGTDSLNYYEISFPFDQVEVDPNSGWVEVQVPIDKMTSAKVDDSIARDVTLPSGEIIRQGTIHDNLSGSIYDLVIRGRPDLRRVRRYYAGLRYPKKTDGTGVPVGPLLTGDVLLNELRIRRVNRKTGYAKQLSVSSNIPGLGDFSGSISQTDAEFRGLNRDRGSGSTDQDAQMRASSKLQYLIPTFGVDVPFSFSATKRTSVPKYYPNNDITLFDSDLQDSLSTKDSNESFNFQLRKQGTSQNKVLAYTVDRLSYSYSRTRSRRSSPRQNTRRLSSNSQYNYDLNFATRGIVTIPILGYDFRYLPNQLSLGSVWSKDETKTTNKFEDGSYQLTGTSHRGVSNTASIAWSPARNLRLLYSIRSLRDPDRRQLIVDDTGAVIDEKKVEFLGVNWGAENSHTERFSANYTPLFPGISWLKPDIQFTGSYSENRAVSVRRTRVEKRVNPDTGEEEDVTIYLDPAPVRHLSNSGDLTVRGEVGLNRFFQKILGSGGARRMSPRQNLPRERKAQERKKRERSSSLPSTGPSGVEKVPPPHPQVQEAPSLAPADSTGAAAADSTRAGAIPMGLGVVLPPMQGSSADSSETRVKTTPAEADSTRGAKPALPPAAPPGRAGQTEVAAPAQKPKEQPGQEDEAEGQRIDPGAALSALFSPITNALRGLQPFRVSYNQRRQNSYQHASNRAALGFRLGLLDDPRVKGAGSQYDAAGNPIDDQFSSYNHRPSNNLSVSTQTKLNNDIRMDLSYSRNWDTQSSNLQSGRKNTSRQWPVVTLKIQNVHKWRIFGESMANSSIDFAYRNTQTTSGVTSVNAGTPHQDPEHSAAVECTLQERRCGQCQRKRHQGRDTVGR